MESIERRASQQADALLPTFAQDAKLTVTEVDIGDTGASDLADAQARRLGALADGPVA